MALAPYGSSLALLTDLYELTMACGYWKAGIAEREAVFHLSFRRHPFSGGFTLACGLGPAVEFLRCLRFDASDVDYLASLRDDHGGALLDPAFVANLRGFELRVDLDAVPEGTAVFPNEPLLRVRGPLLQAQLLETALLNLINFQSLIATKAARVALAAGDDPVLEFGLRRAQGVDGGLAASRAAYIGGCAATSNVLAGKLFGIPVRGTHAHSWVMSFDSEAEAFEAWADVMPRNAVFLVDTYDTAGGVDEAIRAGRRLREKGFELAGVRLDSGDLGALAVEARGKLDQAGFPQAVVVASGDLDEAAILALKARGAPIGVWGVGTRLVTAHDDPALSGVYKLGCIRDAQGGWRGKRKLSDDPEKATLPGILQVRRHYGESGPLADIIYDEREGPSDPGHRIDLRGSVRQIDLLQPVLRAGAVVAEPPDIEAARRRAREQLLEFGITGPQSTPDFAVAMTPDLGAKLAG